MKVQECETQKHSLYGHTRMRENHTHRKNREADEEAMHRFFAQEIREMGPRAGFSINTLFEEYSAMLSE